MTNALNVVQFQIMYCNTILLRVVKRKNKNKKINQNK